MSGTEKERHNPEKKLWKKKTVKLSFFGLIIFSVGAVFLGFPADTAFWIIFPIIFLTGMYGRVTGRLEIDKNHKELSNAGRLGYDDFGLPGSPLSRY